MQCLDAIYSCACLDVVWFRLCVSHTWECWTDRDAILVLDSLAKGAVNRMCYNLPREETVMDDDIRIFQRAVNHFS